MKTLSAIALLSALVLLAPNASTAESDVSGKWIFNMAGPNGETVELPMELEVNDKELKGRVDRGGGQWLKLKDGKVDGAKISFTVERDRPGGGTMIYAVTGKLADDKLSGEAKTDFQGQEVSGQWHAIRQVEEKSAIAGSWTLHLKDPNGGDVELPMEFKVTKQTLSGRVGRGDDRWMLVEDGTVDGNKFSFTVKRDRPGGGKMVYKMVGEATQARLKGTTTTTMDGAGDITAEWHADRPTK